VSEDFITLNKRELKLLKAYMGHHNWTHLTVSYPEKSNLYDEYSVTLKKYGGLRERFKMTSDEIDTFRSKLGI
jgi:hypothetical protein